MIPALEFQVEESEAFKAGQMVGQMVPLVLVAIGAVWCFAILKRPGVNRKGVASLAILLVSWGVAMAGPMTKVMALGIVSGGLCVVGLLTCIVLAIAALVDEAPGKYRQGKGQAISTLVLAGLMIMAGLFFAVTTILTKARESSEARTAAQGKPIELPEQQFRLKSLPSPWVRIPNPGRLNPLACLGLSRSRPEMYFMVISEKMTAENDDTLELFTGAVKSNLLQADPTAQFVEEKPEIINGRAGTRIVATARVSNLDLVYRYWLHCSPGHAYQVISWSPAKDRASMMAQSEALFSGIEILAPKE